MKTFSVLFALAALMIVQPDAFAQRGGGDTRGSSGSSDTRGSSDGGSSRGSDYSTRGSSSGSSSSDYGSSSGSSSSDWGSSGGCYDCYSGSFGGYSAPRIRNTKFRDLDVGMKVKVLHLNENGVITEMFKRFLSASICVELEKSKEEICGLKPKDVRPN